MLIVSISVPDYGDDNPDPAIFQSTLSDINGSDASSFLEVRQSDLEVTYREASGHGSSSAEEESEPRNEGPFHAGERPGPENQFA
jgi:hypothetical protein